MIKRTTGLTILLWVTLTAGIAFCKTYYVDPNGSNFADGLTWATAFRSIQTAIDATVPDDTIVVNEGTYLERLFIGSDTKNVSCKITSTNPKDINVVKATVIDGKGADAVIRMGYGTSSQVSGLTITGGDCGIAIEKGAIPVINNCIIRNNVKFGIFGMRSTITITNCIISNNDGLGIFARLVGIHAKNNVVRDNNEGITIFGPQTGGELRNITVVNNRNYGIKTAEEMKLTISNCIMWNNGGNDLLGHDATYCCIKDSNDANGTGNIRSDPRFTDARGNNFHLAANSPCINAGDAKESYTDERDIDGEPRVMDGRVDIGADEANVIPGNTGKK
jgi:hypothetical protein